MIRNYIFTVTSGLALFFSVTVSPVSAQAFSIVSAGEALLGTDQIAEEGIVREYLAFNVSGSGTAILKISAGDESAQKAREVVRNPTRFISYLLSHELATEIARPFRRGVRGTITIDVLETSDVISDSTSITLDVRRSKQECRKFPSKRLKGCKQLDLDRATPAQRRLFVQRLVDSIRGPIVLEE